MTKQTEALKMAILQFERINKKYDCTEIIDICKEALEHEKMLVKYNIKTENKKNVNHGSQTEALKMAIEAWDRIDTTNQSNLECARQWFIEGYVQALEQPAQEPVDVARVQEDGYVEWNPDLPDFPVGTKLYTHPTPSWQGLSEYEVNDVKTKAIMGANGMSVEQLLGLIVSLTEQALKEKNT